MNRMRSIGVCLLLALLAGCNQPPPYGQEQPLQLQTATHAIWAVAPAVNLSGETSVDPLLQADILFEQLQAVKNITAIPVNRVVEVFAALKIEKIESEEQAALVCQQLGCDAVLVPTITVYDPYDPPKMGGALQLLSKPGSVTQPPLDIRQLSRETTPDVTQTLPEHPNFIQAVGMYDSANGTVRDAVLNYAKGRNDPSGPLGSKEYFVSMDRYSGFVYHALITQVIGEVAAREAPPAKPVETAPPPAMNGDPVPQNFGNSSPGSTPPAN